MSSNENIDRLNAWSLGLHRGGQWFGKFLVIGVLAAVVGGSLWYGGWRLKTSQAQRDAVENSIHLYFEKPFLGAQQYAWDLQKLEPQLDRGTRNAKDSFFFFLMGFGGTVFLTWKLTGGLAKKAKDQHRRRGSQIAPPKEVARRVVRDAKRRKAGTAEFELAGVPLPPASERQHMLMIGSTGVGKSTAIRELLDQVRARGEKAIIYDPGGHYLSAYAEPGHNDAFLNVFDRRSDEWSIFSEIQNENDAQAVASALIPSSEGDKGGEFWSGSARNLLASVLWKLTQTNPTMSELHNVLLCSSAQELRDYLAGTSGGAGLGTGEGEQAGGVVAHAAQRTQWLQHLAQRERAAGAGNFSLRKWIREDAGGFCYLGSRADHKEQLAPLLSLYVDLAAREILSMGDSQGRRRIWIIVDELADLQKMPKLMDLLAQGRKYGAAVVIGVQNLGQLRQIWSRDGAVALMDLCSTKLIYRTGDPEAAEYGQKCLGEVEVERKDQGQNSGGQGRFSASERIERVPLVMASEIQTLPDLAAYLILAGDYPRSQIEIQYRKPEIRMAEFREWRAPVC